MHLAEIIQTIKKRRRILDITQEDLAELAGIGSRTLKALEVGKSNPTFDTLSKIADVLGMKLTLEIKKPKGN